MIHGRFQPFHVGHLEYLRLAAEQSEELVVGITNPDARSSVFEAADPARSEAAANPWSYLERYRMIQAVLREEGLERSPIVPFPVSDTELWSSYAPAGVTHFLRVFDAWGEAKANRLRGAGYDVVVLAAGTAKTVSGKDVRVRLAQGGDWRALVPAGVAEVIDARNLRRPA